MAEEVKKIDLRDMDQIYIPNSKTISILGTGDYARAFGQRLFNTGYDVVYGSRSPERRRAVLGSHGRLLSIEDAIKAAQIIVLAVHMDNQPDLLQGKKALLVGKIVVDVSNPDNRCKGMSNAERLAEMLSESHVIKAFNTISAYSLLESGISRGMSTVHVCGNHTQSKDVVIELAREMGFTALDCGRLGAARDTERLALILLTGWGYPSVFCGIVLLLWLGYCIFQYHFYNHKRYDWHRLPLNLINKAIACSALTLLSLCFMPGCIAAFAQIVNGTKYKQFPRWLDSWMKARKQIGVITFGLVFLHCVMSLGMFNPAYFPESFHAHTIIIPKNRTEDVEVPIAVRMNWKGELSLTMAALAFFCMCLLALTSVPPVGKLLSWREWRFIQSGFGYICLALATVHVMLKTVPSWFHESFPVVLQSTTLICLWFPWITLFLKALILLPCIGQYVDKIRHGYERRGHPKTSAHQAESATTNGFRVKEEHLLQQKSASTEPGLGHDNLGFMHDTYHNTVM